jgi:hypothetical protein
VRKLGDYEAEKLVGWEGRHRFGYLFREYCITAHLLRSLEASPYDFPACPGVSTGSYLAGQARRKDKGIRRKTLGKRFDESLLVI